MARQLSLGEEKLFQQVNHLEFLNKAWLAQNPEAGAPALSYASPPPLYSTGGDAHGGRCGRSALRNRFDRVRNWVATEILKGVNDDVRAQVIFNFIQIAEVHSAAHATAHTRTHAHKGTTLLLTRFAFQRCCLSWPYDSIACK